MRTVSAIDKQISDYLVHLNMGQKKAVLTIMKAFISEEDIEKDDEDFEKEMNKRFAEMESGAIKGYSFEEATARARQAYKTSKNDR